MISEPGRYIDEYLDAGCDSITIHVEIEEPIEPTLRPSGGRPGRRARPQAEDAPRRAGAIRGAARHRDGHDGRAGVRRPAVHGRRRAREAPAGARLPGHKLHGGEVHVDGGVNRETAELVGGLGVDILVVGSALFVKGRDMGREIRLIRALADEGYQFQLNDGQPPIPRDRMVRFTSLRSTGARAHGRDRGGRDPRDHAPQRRPDDPDEVRD